MQRTRSCLWVIAIATLLGASIEAAAQQAGGARAASGLVGKLEGFELILDPSKWPTTFHESPDLAAQVKAGKLPPVAQRVPQETRVLNPAARPAGQASRR